MGPSFSYNIGDLGCVGEGPTPLQRFLTQATGAAWGADFTNRYGEDGLYYVKGASVSAPGFATTVRNTPVILPDANGVLMEVSGGTLPRTSAGLQVYPGTTNKGTSYNASPISVIVGTDATSFNADSHSVNVTASGGDGNTTWGIVDDSAMITAAGLGEVSNGLVYKIDNIAGMSTATMVIGGTVGNTNKHAVSVYWRGAGTIRNRLSTTPASNESAPAGYVRQVNVYTPVNSDESQTIQAVPGAVVYFTLTQLEERSDATPVVITAGASTSRTGDIVSAVEGAGSIPFPEFVPAGIMLYEWRTAGAGTDRILGALQGSLSDDESIRQRITSTELWQNIVREGSITVANILGGAPVDGTVHKAAFGFGPGFAALVVDQVQIGSTDTTVTIPTVADFLIGSRGSSEQLGGELKSICYIPGTPSLAQMQSLTEMSAF